MDRKIIPWNKSRGEKKKEKYIVDPSNLRKDELPHGGRKTLGKK